MPSSSWPPAPQLPRSLWLTGGALLLALLSYGFQAELWPNHPDAGGWSLALLPVLLMVGMVQLLKALHFWVITITGPGWLCLILRAGLAAVQVGTAFLIVAVLLGGIIALVLLS